MLYKKTASNFHSHNDRMHVHECMQFLLSEIKKTKKKPAVENERTDYLSLLPQVELLDEVVLLRVSAISFLTVDRRSVDMLFLTDEKCVHGDKSTGMLLYTAHI